jgi:hypothetical protein
MTYTHTLWYSIIYISPSWGVVFEAKKIFCLTPDMYWQLIALIFFLTFSLIYKVRFCENFNFCKKISRKSPRSLCFR